MRVTGLVALTFGAWSMGSLALGCVATVQAHIQRETGRADTRGLSVLREGTVGAPDALPSSGTLNVARYPYPGARRGVDLERRIARVRQAAHNGNAQAEHILGLCYAQGLGVRQSYERANYWFFRAAQQHLPAAENDLGFDYAWGRGMSINIRMANAWYRRAARQGYAPAETNLGFDYANGFGMPVNRARAVHWWEQAARQGDRRAARDLSVLAASDAKNLPGALD